MKKIIARMIICVMCFVLVACGSSKPKGVSDDAYDLGVKAVEVTQQYLDGNIDVRELEKKLNKFDSQISDTGVDKQNVSITLKLTEIKAAAIIDKSDAKVLKLKNELKKFLGL